MNLKSLSDSALLSKVELLVNKERRVSVEILWHLREIEKRQLFAKRGYSSLWEYATQALGYSAGAASRRLQSMRLLQDLPEVEPAIQSGKVSLSTVSALQTFIRQDEKIRDEKYTTEEKRDLFEQIQGKSKAECESLFIGISPEAVAQTTGERERLVSPNHTEIRFVADDELMAQLKRIRELSAHRNPDPSYLELFKYLSELALKKLEPVKDSKPASASVTPPADIAKRHTENRYVPSPLRRYIWKRDHGVCTYVDPLTQKSCGSRHGLQIDHVVPIKLGGTTIDTNLRLLCATHNRLAATQAFGHGIMASYCDRLRD